MTAKSVHFQKALSTHNVRGGVNKRAFIFATCESQQHLQWLQVETAAG